MILSVSTRFSLQIHFIVLNVPNIENFKVYPPPRPYSVENHHTLFFVSCLSLAIIKIYFFMKMFILDIEILLVISSSLNKKFDIC